MYYKSKVGDIYYKIIGKGKPVVILHGFHLDHRVMKACLEPTFKSVKGFKRIYIDLPGMGKSRNVSSIKSSNDILTITKSLISRLLGKTHFYVIGYSYGGYLAQCMVAKNSRCIDGMFLFAPVIIPNTKKRDIGKHRALIKKYRPATFTNKKEKETFSNLVVQTKKVWHDVQKYILPGFAATNTPLLDYIFNSSYGISENIIKLKHKYTKPVHIILGRYDSFVGYKDALKIMDNYPRASFIILDSAGHNLQFEQPSIFRGQIKDWLNRLAN